jgi:hypothetical protein
MTVAPPGGALSREAWNISSLHVPRSVHDVNADHLQADQIVPTEDERKLGARCLFAKARADRGPPPAHHAAAV